MSYKRSRAGSQIGSPSHSTLSDCLSPSHVTDCGWRTPLVLVPVGPRWRLESSRAASAPAISCHGRRDPTLRHLLKQKQASVRKDSFMPGAPSQAGSCFPTVESGFGREARGHVPVPVGVVLSFGWAIVAASLCLVPRAVAWPSLASSQLSFPRAGEWELLGTVPL